MKIKFIFSVIIIAVLYIGKINAGVIPNIGKAILSEKDKAILDEHLSEYVTFTIDKKELMDNLYKNGKCQFQIRIDEKRDWTFDLQLNDMRAPDLRLIERG